MTLENVTPEREEGHWLRSRKATQHILLKVNIWKYQGTRHTASLWSPMVRFYQLCTEAMHQFSNRSDDRMYVSSSFAGNKEPGFARYTIPVPVLEPTVPVGTDAPADLSPVSCSIFPPTGTVLDAFDITCKASSFCSAGCSYCFRTDAGENVSLRGKSEENAD